MWLLECEQSKDLAKEIGSVRFSQASEWILSCLQLESFLHVLSCLLIDTLFVNGLEWRCALLMWLIIYFDEWTSFFWDVGWIHCGIYNSMDIEMFECLNCWDFDVSVVMNYWIARILDETIDISFESKWKDFRTKLYMLNDLRIHMEWFGNALWHVS